MTELQPRPIEPTIRSLLNGERDARTKVEAKFAATHKKHPEVYDHFCMFTRQLTNAGSVKGSVAAVVERIRWQTMIGPTDEGVPGIVVPLKVSNNSRAYLGRLWMEDHPEYPDFFVVRPVGAEPESSDTAWNQMFGLDD
jgi:hypothetical protein